MSLKTQAALEFARFFASHPTSEQILAFHPSPEVAERVYELIYAERDGLLTDEKREELDSYMVIEGIVRLTKLEIRRHVGHQQA